MNKQLIILAILFAAILGLQGNASAHVVIKDDTAKTGVVFHITPDDDPVAGEASQLFFDFEQPADNYSFGIKIINASGKVTNSFVTVNKQTVSTNYIFPEQGLYHIELTAQAKRPGITSLHYDAHQQVERGAGQKTISNHTAAKVSLLGGMAALVVLLAGGVLRRRYMARRDT
ncbi:MAG: hypothetical protein JWM81_828 [Candidatus Saccharibacteria bacterium]|nr:hypothetical protein [Candidatus Saccharibacteria bacterium]